MQAIEPPRAVPRAYLLTSPVLPQNHSKAHFHGPVPPARQLYSVAKDQTGGTRFLAIVQGNCSRETPGPKRNEILWCG